ncbi:MAG: spore germination protein [Tumebacillaceae bacterium]
MGFVKRMVKNLFNRSTSGETRRLAPVHQKPLQHRMDQTIEQVRQVLGNSTDLIIRELCIGAGGTIRACLLYTDGLADKNAIQEFIHKSMHFSETEVDANPKSASQHKWLLLLNALGPVHHIGDFETLYDAILTGSTVVLLDGHAQGYVAVTNGWDDRGVQEPSTQTVVRGPREGFCETLRTNTALVRRKIKDPNLWLETRKIGRVTQTEVAVMYLRGVVNEKVVDEVRSRLDRIDIDGILESGYIEELIQDETYTPFPTMFNTERPDVVAAGLMEGRVAILVDGTPFALLVPALFVQFFQAAEDYYQRADIGTLLRLLRFLSFFIALLAPSLYIAISTFHQEMLPTSLLISLAAQREGVPFPAFVEAMIMEIIFEILREAGVRMPRSVGQAVSIVGALVIGQAAVEAGLVAPAMVIVVSLTAISNFVFPSFNMAISIRIIRFLLMFLAASFGLYGVTMGLIALVLHLCSLRSFGVPYLAPMAPFILDDQKDALFRLPQWALFSRPRLLSQKNIYREQNPAPEKPNQEQSRAERSEG